MPSHYLFDEVEIEFVLRRLNLYVTIDRWIGGFNATIIGEPFTFTTSTILFVCLFVCLWSSKNKCIYFSISDSFERIKHMTLDMTL